MHAVLVQRRMCRVVLCIVTWQCWRWWLHCVDCDHIMPCDVNHRISLLLL